MEDAKNGPTHGIYGWVVTAVAWLAAAAGAVYTLLKAREGILAVIRATVSNVWSHAFFDKGVLLLMTLATLVGVMWTQHYYVRGYEQQGTIAAVLRRAVRVLIVEAIVLVVSIALTQILS